MITPSFGLTATERVLPRLALDFTTASLDPRVTFTRTGNTATVTNSSGYVTPINADLPRFDFDPITLVCKGLLIEESRTNITFQSEDFIAAVWTTLAVGATVSGNVVVSPSGALTADKMIINNGATTNYLRQTTAVTATIYTFSLYAKAAEFNTVSLQLGNLWSPAPAATFNVATGTITASSNCTATITPVGNEWYRCVMVSTVTPTAGGTGRTFIYSGNNGNIGVTGDGTSGIYIWGAQVEAGAFATSFIPTVAAAVTRNADNAVMTGTNFSSWYNASEGALQTVSTTISTTQETSTGASLYLDGSNFMATYFGQANKPRLLVRNAGTFDVNTTASVAQSNPFDQVFAYKSGSISFASNATLIVNSVNKPIPTPNSLYIGHYPTVGAAGYANAWISRVAYWPQRLINNEVIAFSK